MSNKPTSMQAGRRILRVEPLESRRLMAFSSVATSLPNVGYSSVAWGDYDSDGDLDVLLTGFLSGTGAIARIYKNTNGSFSDISAGLTGVATSQAQGTFGVGAWGDYDNDGDLDVLIAGSTSKVYRNTNGTFSDISAPLIGVGALTNSSAAWGDYDNDGDLDILLTGFNGGPTSKIYRNSNGTFSDINASLPGVSYSSVAWGDYDNDGDLDVLLSGVTSGNGTITLIIRNTNGTFAAQVASFYGGRSSAVAWGDYDNDGDLDLLVSGQGPGGGRVATVYRNTNGSFGLVANLQGVVNSSVAWGDYDNDGDLDVMVSGRNQGEALTGTVYQNTSGVFNGAFNLSPMHFGSMAWGDYDNDGDLDILQSGSVFGAATTTLLKNDSTRLNSTPNAPTGLATVFPSTTSVTFSWTAPADQTPTPTGTGTPSAGLSYNLRVGTTPGASNVFSTMANSTNGYRRQPQTGPIQGTSYTLNGLTPFTRYYWSVQAVDTALAGGAFAAEANFYNGTFSDIGSALTGVNNSSVAWGDYDNDGDQDILLTGSDSGTTRISKIYRNTNGTFSDISAGLIGVDLGSVAWGDYDNDGDLDVLLSGATSSTTRATRIYRNTNGTFSDIVAGLTDVSRGALAWGDYDNDGDLDVLLTGTSASGNVSRVYRNTSGTFSDISAGLTGVTASAADWGDYDSDGDLDILLTGSTGTNTEVSKIYRNSNGLFSDVSAGLTGFYNSSVDWGDYDNDGDLDIVLAGRFGGSYSSRVYRNTSGTFSAIVTGLTAVNRSSVAWGDYDNDGDLDALISGRGSSGISTKVYRNTNGTFSDISDAFLGADLGSVAWSDFDNDGDLDALVTGADSGGTRFSKIYRNLGNTFNRAPIAPSGLSSAVDSPTSMTLSWTAATDQTPTPSGTATPTIGLSYNLRVGTSPGASDVFSSMANSTSGYRLVPETAILQGTSYKLKGLTPGQNYYWSVQAIDTALAGGAFATEATFHVNGAPTAVVLTPSSASLPEDFNTSTFTSVSTISITDDGFGTNTLSLDGPDASSFEIVGNVLRLKAGVALDRETKQSYSVIVNVDDATLGGSVDAFAAFTLNVSNVNEPPIVTPVTFSLPENSANGTVVGTVVAVDPDAGTTLSYSITTGNTGNSFAIDNTGKITVANVAAINFETTPSFSLTVQASDNESTPLSGTAIVTINLTNVNEPPVVDDQIFGVAENSSNGTVVGSVATNDVDASDSRTLVVTGGTGASIFAVNSSDGQITVVDGSALNFEATTSYTLDVSVTDVGGLLDTAQITVNLTNVNENPTALNLSSTSIAENNPANALVGLLSSSDPDTGDIFTYHLVTGNGSADNAAFTIVGSQLVANSTFNHESKSSYAIRVRTTDSGLLSFEKELTITVDNVLEMPTPVQIGDGTTQRSVVNKLVVSFDQAIEFDAGAFQVFQRVKDSNNALVLVPVTTNVTLASTAGGMTATLTFSGSLTRAGTNALVDGNYQLTINGGLIRILNTTRTFDADGDGNGGGLYTLGNQAADNFFALLGDANGNGEVDAQDILGAKLALRKSIGQSGYNSAYDINGNGVVDAQDILNIQLNLRKKRVFF